VGSFDVVQINGVPVRIHASFQREIKDESGQLVTEMELAVMIRGRMQNKQFVQHLSVEQARLVFEETASKFVTLNTRITNHTSAGSGEGESTVYRHDLTFREEAQSAHERRAAIEAAMPAQVAPEPVCFNRRHDDPKEDDREISDVKIGTSASDWGDAIRQLQKPTTGPRIREEPLEKLELVAIESVLTNLRVDALLDQLEAAGVVRRGAVDERFRALVEKRFVAEAIPLVGERVARRALKEMDS
jgi:hypothetical protein